MIAHAEGSTNGTVLAGMGLAYSGSHTWASTSPSPSLALHAQPLDMWGGLIHIIPPRPALFGRTDQFRAGGGELLDTLLGLIKR
jgi:hypothetical protein